MRLRLPSPPALIAGALLTACVAVASRDTQVAFVGAHAATPAEVRAAAAAAGWTLEESREFPADETGAVVVAEHVLARADGHGRATLHLVAGMAGGTPVTVQVEERAGDGNMFALIEALRRAFDVAPTWQTPGAVYCVDHRPRHVVLSDDPDAARAQLAAAHGCRQVGTTPPLEP